MSDVSAAHDGFSRRILLVDDDAMAREFMHTRLTRRGFDVRLAASGFECLDQLEQGGVDLILLDIMMPGMTGVEALSRVREHHSMLSLPVIMLTANDMEEMVVDALSRGANDYIVKPIAMPILLARMQTQLSLRHLSLLKDEFLQFASHDLKKPLMLLLDVAGEIKREMVENTDRSEQTVESLDLMLRTGSDMQQVIQGFLDRRAQSGNGAMRKRESVNVHMLIRQIVHANAQYAQRKGVRLSAQLNDDAITVPGDAFALGQVLDNIVGNAIKYSPHGSETVIHCGAHESYLHIEISDTGPGIPSGEMELLFTKGAQLSNAPTGNETRSGIGLALCKNLVEQHHGEIGARNNTERGATFWVKLPLEISSRSPSF